MRHILTLSLLLTVVSLHGQSFEWTTKEKAPATHPKEVVTPVPGDQTATGETQTGLAGVYTSDAQGTRTAYGETYNGKEMTGSHAALPLGTLLRVTNTENGKTVVVRVTDRGKECADCLITLSAVAAKELGIDSPSPVSLERSGFSNWNPAPPVAIAPAPVNYSAPAPTAKEVAAQPSVVSREVDPAPATYNRYPRIARPVVAPTATAADASVAPPAPTVAPEREARGGTVVPAAPDVNSPAAEQYTIQLAAYSNEDYALRRVSELKEQGISDVYYRSITKADGGVINRVYSGTYGTLTDAQSAARDIQGKFNLAGIVAKL